MTTVHAPRARAAATTAPPGNTPHLCRVVHSTAAPTRSTPATSVNTSSAHDLQPLMLYTTEYPAPPPPPPVCPCHQLVDSAANARSATTAANRPRSPRRPGGRSAGAERPETGSGAASIDSASVGMNAY